MQGTQRATALLGLVALAALGSAATPAHAQGVFAFSNGSPRSTTDGSAAPGYTIGYTFTTGSQPTSLYALGYSTLFSSLAEDHEVALFTPGGTELADTVLTAGTTASGGYAYTTTFTKENGFTGLLTPDTTYLIGGYVGQNLDAFTDHATSVTGADGFTYGSAHLLDPNPNGFGAPLTEAGGVTFGAYAGPNLQVVPEPATYAAFAFTGLGTAGLMLRARKRHTDA